MLLTEQDGWDILTGWNGVERERQRGGGAPGCLSTPRWLNVWLHEIEGAAVATYCGARCVSPPTEETLKPLIHLSHLVRYSANDPCEPCPTAVGSFFLLSVALRKYRKRKVITTSHHLSNINPPSPAEHHQHQQNHNQNQRSHHKRRQQRRRRRRRRRR